MEYRFASGTLELVGELHRPPRDGAGPRPALVLCHGFPNAKGDVLAMAGLPELAKHICETLDMVVLTFRFRGCAPSEGYFSLGGWLEDLRAAIDELERDDQVGRVWVTGFGTGGSLCLCAGASDPRIEGVAALAAPADFDDWALHPDELLDHAVEVEAVSDASLISDLEAWATELGEIQAYNAVSDLAPRALLVVHGSEDQMVSVLDARLICDTHGEAELLIIAGADHGLRHDPRAIASLLGWLDRQTGLQVIGASEPLAGDDPGNDPAASAEPAPTRSAE